ncbi:hypothetical protein K435DRAFT_687625, partial [Dendrothele bispora CBS 962.96]
KEGNEVHQVKAYREIRPNCFSLFLFLTYLASVKRFIIFVDTYANTDRQAKSEQKILNKMEAAGLIAKIEIPRPLRFNFEDLCQLYPPYHCFQRSHMFLFWKRELNISFSLSK